MKEEKKLGIFMDHANAQVMEYTPDEIKTKIVTSKFTHQGKEHSLSHGENVMHHAEQHEQVEYYKKLGETIRHFDDVLLFGPTSAKVELLNALRADHNFAKIKFEVRQADKMTENQQHAFVRKHFSQI